VREGREQIDAWTLSFPALVPAAVASTVQSQSNIAYRLQAVVELKGPIFWETESIRIDSSSESNRTDSNRELECTNSEPPTAQSKLSQKTIAYKVQSKKNYRV